MWLLPFRAIVVVTGAMLLCLGPLLRGHVQQTKPAGGQEDSLLGRVDPVFGEGVLHAGNGVVVFAKPDRTQVSQLSVMDIKRGVTIFQWDTARAREIPRTLTMGANQDDMASIAWVDNGMDGVFDARITLDKKNPLGLDVGSAILVKSEWTPGRFTNEDQTVFETADGVFRFRAETSSWERQ